MNALTKTSKTDEYNAGENQELTLQLETTPTDRLKGLISRIISRCPTLAEIEDAFNWHHSKIDVVGVTAYATELSDLTVEPADLIAFWLTGFCSGYSFGNVSSGFTSAGSKEVWSELMKLREKDAIEL